MASIDVEFIEGIKELLRQVHNAKSLKEAKAAVMEFQDDFVEILELRAPKNI